MEIEAGNHSQSITKITTNNNRLSSSSWSEQEAVLQMQRELDCLIAPHVKPESEKDDLFVHKVATPNRLFIRFSSLQIMIMIMFFISLTVVKVIDCRLAPASGPKPAAYTKSTPSDIIHLHKEYYHLGPFSTFSLVVFAIFTVVIVVIWVVHVIRIVVYIVHRRSQALQQEEEMMPM